MRKLKQSLATQSQVPAGLTRRSLCAAVGVAAAASMARANSALAMGRPPPFRHRRDHDGKHDLELGGSHADKRLGGSSCEPSCICFLEGTLIATPQGDAPIEDLGPGSLVLTVSGAVQEVRWVGRMSFIRDTGGNLPRSVLPVRVSRDALGENQPARDLYVSQAHRLYLEGMLVPAADLINGVTITSHEPETETLTYYHVELAQHDVVFAEGATCDTLQVTPENVRVFDNHAERTALLGECTTAMAPYAPIHRFGGGRGKLASRLRSAVAPVHDMRLPIDVMRDQLEARAAAL